MEEAVKSWVSPDDSLALWTFLVGWAAVSIWLEQKYRWAATLTGCMIALLGAMLLANLNIVPLNAPAYDIVWDYVIPLAIPLLLFDADIRRIWKESGRTFIAFHFSALGTMIGTFVATFLFHTYIPELRGIIAMLCGTYIGGSLNLAAMKDAFGVSSELTSAAIVADNFLMAAYFFIIMTIPTLAFFRKRYKMSYDAKLASESASEASEEGKNRAALFWGRKEISLLDIAGSVAMTFLIVLVSTKVAGYLGGANSPITGDFAQTTFGEILKLIVGQKYLLITAFTVVGATFFPKFFSNLKGSKEIGTLFIHIFFVVLGVPASLLMIWREAPMLFAYAGVILLVNLLVTLGLGKCFGFDLEELMVSCNATAGGPTTAAAMVIAKGWTDLVVPAMLVGIWGYVIGNYAAIGMVKFLESFLQLP